MTIPFKIKKLGPNAKMPKRADPGSSGFDLFAAEEGCLLPGETLMVDLQLSMEVPVGYEVQIRPRSGLAAKYGVTVLNTPGTVDASFRGPVKVILHNTNQVEAYPFCIGDRIAQAVVMKLPEVEILEVTDLSDTSRGTGGFGSTGV